MPALSLPRIRRNPRSVCESEPRSRLRETLDDQSSHVLLADDGALDLHQRVKLRFEESPLYQVLHVHSVPDYADAPGVASGYSPAVEEFLRVRNVVEMLTGDVPNAVEAMQPRS